MSDENEFNRDMDAVNNIMINYDVEETIIKLEKRRSVRTPSLHRKILGKWIPVLWRGELLAMNDKPVDNDGGFEVPYMVEVFRTGGRKYGPKNHYGIFDLKLSNGENLTVRIIDGDEEDVVCTNVVASDSNEPVLLGTLGKDDRSIYLGGITYVTDYILIQRDKDGKIDLWVRADDTHLGVKDSNVAIGEIKVE